MPTRKLKVHSEDAAYYSANEDAVIALALAILEKRARNRATIHGALQSPENAGAFIKLAFADCDPGREHFLLIGLNSKHCVVGTEFMFVGTVDGAEVHPRDIVRQCLKWDACAMILAHNHPSGDQQPSAADIAATARIKQAGNLVGVRLLDHFITGGAGVPTSLAAMGKI